MNGLRIHFPNNQEKVISFNTRMIKIGASSSCEISIVDNRIPEVAAVIVREPDGVYFKTAHAGELVKFNGETVPSIKITPGDKIQIGNVVITPLYERSDDEPSGTYPKHIIVHPPGRDLPGTKIPVSETVVETLALRMRVVKMAAAMAGGVILAFFCWQILAVIFPSHDVESTASVDSAFPEIMGYLIGGERGQEAAAVLKENQTVIQHWKEDFKTKLSSGEQQELLQSLARDKNREQAVREFFDRSRENSGAAELRDEIRKYAESDEFQQIREKIKSRAKPAAESPKPVSKPQ
jgi:hypothetical protein